MVEKTSHDFLSDLLKVIADPKGSTERLKQHADAFNNAEAARAAAKKYHDDAERKLNEAFDAEQRAKALHASTQGQAAALATAQQGLVERERALVEWERDLAHRAANHGDYVNRTTADLKAREAKLAEQEKALAPKLEKFAADREALDKRMKEARAFLQV